MRYDTTDEWIIKAGRGGPALVIEPGRSIVGGSAITLSRVSHVRKIAGHHNLVTLEMGVTNFGTALVY